MSQSNHNNGSSNGSSSNGNGSSKPKTYGAVALARQASSVLSSKGQKFDRLDSFINDQASGSTKSSIRRTISSALNNNGGKESKHSILGIFFIMLGAFSFSVMFLIVKLMADTNTFTLVFYRSLLQIALAYMSLVFVEKEANPWGPPDQRLFLALRAVFGALAVCAFFFGIQILPLPDAVTLQFTTPPFAAAFAVCLVGEKWLPLDMLGAIVCFTGVALIAHPTWLFGPSSSAATDEEDDDDGASGTLKAMAVLVCTGGAAAAGYAYVLVRKIGNSASANVMVLYYGIFSMPLLFVGSGLLVGDWTVWNDIPEWTWREVVLLLLMGLGGYGGQLFYNLGLQRETAATGTLVTTTQIVWTYVFELAFLHEGVDMWSLGGTGLILGYMLLVGLIKMFVPEDEEDDDDDFVLSEEDAALVGEERQHQTEEMTSLLPKNSNGDIQV